MSACNLCRSLIKNEDRTRLVFDFVPSELVKSAKETECLPCKVLLDGIQRFEEDSWDLSRDVARVYAYGYGLAEQGDSLSLELYFADERPKLVLEFYYRQQKDLSSDKGIDWMAIRPRPSLSGHPLSPAAMDWLTTKIGICEKKHACQSHAVTRLPKRTLTFQKSPNGEIALKLVENASNHGRYISLSHCWGSSQHCTLTSKTFHDYRDSMSWSKLPKTFQDAIIFSIKLGIYHIWIDALCIIQDSPADWEEESAKMADIYQNSYLTLAATASTDDTGGCFTEKNAAAVTEFEISVQRSATYSNPIMVRKKVQHWTWPPSKASMNLHPLLSRGWAFQERILSPRLLHFCKEELLWECREEVVCECGSLPELPEMKKEFFEARIEDINLSEPRNLSQTEDEDFYQSEEENVSQSEEDNGQSGEGEVRLRRLIWGKVKDWMFQHVRSLESFQKRKSKAQNPLDAVENWHRIVEQYSALKLTRQTDCLPALSGLAARSSPVLGEYLAGLWEVSLVSDLMWRVNLLDIGITKATEYIGPTWSWTSITGAVSYWTEAENAIVLTPGRLEDSWDEGARRGRMKAVVSHLARRVEMTSISGRVEVGGTNPYGKICEGTRLLVDGFLKPARLQWVCVRTQDIERGFSAPTEPVPLKYELEIIEHTKSPIVLPFFADYVLQEEGPQQILHTAEVHLLLIHPSVCLVLRCLQSDASTFRRVGIVRQPWSQISLYGVDWMWGSEKRKIEII